MAGFAEEILADLVAQGLSGQQLLDNYARSRNAMPSVPQRLLRSGLLQVMAGSSLMALAITGIDFLLRYFFKIELPISAF